MAGALIIKSGGRRWRPRRDLTDIDHFECGGRNHSSWSYLSGAKINRHGLFLHHGGLFLHHEELVKRNPL